jgi:hypothetical protein
MYRTSALPQRERVRYYALTLRRAGSEQWEGLTHYLLYWFEHIFEALYSAIE